KELETFEFEKQQGETLIRKEPIGVSGLITPWNFPTNQTSTKIASAFTAGSTVVLKPSELTPFTAIILAEVFEASNIPKDVFNLINRTREILRYIIIYNTDIEIVSITGSRATGKKITKNSIETIKKTAIELGGKSPMIILNDADLDEA